MTGIIGDFRVGEDIVLALEPVAGDPATVTSVTAMMKPALTMANRFVLDDAASGLAMTVTSLGAAGWSVGLGNVDSALLAPGIYGVDARLSVSGAVEITDQTAFISLTRAALA